MHSKQQYSSSSGRQATLRVTSIQCGRVHSMNIIPGRLMAPELPISNSSDRVGVEHPTDAPPAATDSTFDTHGSSDLGRFAPQPSPTPVPPLTPLLVRLLSLPGPDPPGKVPGPPLLVHVRPCERGVLLVGAGRCGGCVGWRVVCGVGGRGGARTGTLRSLATAQATFVRFCAAALSMRGRMPAHTCAGQIHTHKHTDTHTRFKRLQSDSKEDV